MGKSQETWNKKEREKQKQKERKQKAERKQERKENAKKGKSLDEMMAYIDENGVISSTPPDPSRRRKEIRAEDIEIGVPKQIPIDPKDLIRKGIVTFFNDAKGYGFIKDLENQQSVFVHVNSCNEPIAERSKVIYEVEMGPKGASAVNVKLAPKEG